MRSLASELLPHAGKLANQPRVYADANIPAGVVAFMRQRLAWDVLFVIEHDDLRRARDDDHFSLARQLGRTLLTQDHDYFDERRFPSRESGGVIVLSGPDERLLVAVLHRIDRIVFKAARRRAGGTCPPSPLQGRKLHAHPDWPPRRRRR